eukprot:CAMPEP_0205907190 /NCGR_PEP_ID=MMETSP1325-20131115/2385_1 /ASSEMBLY_ACC=CAM_ASM_000708 /TAXON_ID=236786 /ORGANISM="Florenciella sp., Strain RCC1007" /LENGTH=34 /DNA_ID= /DNA_START= /DNA_END= /DNA_ORIENTATION=
MRSSSASFFASLSSTASSSSALKIAIASDSSKAP